MYFTLCLVLNGKCKHANIDMVIMVNIQLNISLLAVIVSMLTLDLPQAAASQSL